MRTKFVLPILFILGACNSSYVPIKTEYKVVKPDEGMYKCGDVPPLPNPDTLTDSQVATLLNDLYANNKICKNSLDSVHQFMDAAQKILEDKNSADSK